MSTSEEIDQQLAGKNGPPPNLIRPGGVEAGPPHFLQSDLRDQAFFAAHRAEILEACRHGRIIPDLTPAAPRPRATQAQKDAAQAAAQASMKGNR
jgi:hypothetical protein